MKICFVVRSLFQQKVDYTTTSLAHEAWKRGHTVAYASIEDFSLRLGHEVLALAAKVPCGRDVDRATFLRALQDHSLRWTPENLSTYDVVFLRYNPNLDPEEIEGAFAPVLDFAKVLEKSGVRFINRPDGLRKSASKLYLSQFPEALHPRLLVSRRSEDIRSFIHDLKKPVILKPLRGCGGKNVFLIRSAKETNLNQIISTLCDRGYIMAQEYIPGPKPGDKRLLLFEGKVFGTGGFSAIYRRVSPRGEIRSNMALGATAEKTTLTEHDLNIVEMLRPQLREDGLDFVGVDIVGNKVIEINVFCPGGLGTIEKLYGVNMSRGLIQQLESQSIPHPTRPQFLETHP